MTTTNIDLMFERHEAEWAQLARDCPDDSARRARAAELSARQRAEIEGFGGGPRSSPAKPFRSEY